MRGRPVFATLFFLGIAYALALPLVNADDSGPSKTRTKEPILTPIDASKSPEPQDSPSPDEPDAPEPPPDTAQLTGEYPAECLQREPGPGGEGFLAVDQGKGIEISEIDGSARATVDDEFPFKWSPSGTYLAGGSGALYDIDGNEVGPSFSGDGPYSWAWSPISDCMVVSSSDNTLVVVPGRDAVPLHDEPLARFAFSPGGGDLAYTEVEEDRAHIWVASLASGEVQRLKTLPLAADRELLIAGWTPSGSHVLFWRGKSEELLKEGVPLYAVSADRTVGKLATVLAHRDFLTACGDDLLAVVGGGARLNTNTKRVARVAPGSEPEFITPDGAHDVSPSCSPDAEFIAVARTADVGGGNERLTILDQSGTVTFQPSDSTYADHYPLWGRGDAGVLFIRRQQGSQPEVWHVSTAAPAQATGVTLRAVHRDPSIFRGSWGHFLDWSAAVPSGVSVTSG